MKTGYSDTTQKETARTTNTGFKSIQRQSKGEHESVIQISSFSDIKLINCVLVPSKQSTKLWPSKFCYIKPCHSPVKRNSHHDNPLSHKAICVHVEWILPFLPLLKQPLSGAQLRWGEWYCRPGQQSPRGGKKNILNKKLILCAQQILNY